VVPRPTIALLACCLGPGVAHAAALSPADQALVDGLALPLHVATLKNGLRVVVQPDHRAPVLTVHLQVPFGSSRDTGQPGWPDRPGLAHLVEHLLYAGSPRAPDGAYDALLSAVGGENNAWTEPYAMAVHATVPVEAMGLLLALEADRMAGLDADSVTAKIDSERRVVERERAIDLDTPGGLDSAARRALLYPRGQGQHWPVLGTPAAVGQVQVGDILAFQGAAFAPGQSVLVLVGDVDPVAAMDAVADSLGAVPPRPVALPQVLAEPPTLPISGLYLDDVAGTTLYAIYPLPPDAAPERPAADLLADWFGLQRQGCLGRMLQRGRLDRLTAWTEPEPGGGRLVIELDAPRGPARRLVAKLDQAVADLVDHAPDQAELERVRARWRAWAARVQEDPVDRAEILARCVLEDGDAACFPGHVAAHLAVDGPQLSAAARDWLSPQRRALLVVTAPKHAGRGLPDSVLVDLPEQR